MYVWVVKIGLGLTKSKPYPASLLYTEQLQSNTAVNMNLTAGPQTLTLQVTGWIGNCIDVNIGYLVY